MSGYPSEMQMKLQLNPLNLLDDEVHITTRALSTQDLVNTTSLVDDDHFTCTVAIQDLAPAVSYQSIDITEVRETLDQLLSKTESSWYTGVYEDRSFIDRLIDPFRNGLDIIQELYDVKMSIDSRPHQMMYFSSSSGREIVEELHNPFYTGLTLVDVVNDQQTDIQSLTSRNNLLQDQVLMLENQMTLILERLAELENKNG